ncbi:IclR family transcriptional regulator [Mesorhizobium sp. LHD-90]|uniref:IclR family transcriptional regulator n=1 Tax=Mesorhizobium sp. LHD-90 TaxID=3071414 RepID=UPI0027E130D7|nr:IclR family transcriptional regulator [Mesorhizobium sp. LHD-90]MDQ6438186.1 IclR family transcriptional regulator [Mesorhizobium sp. LHD-90]
MSAGLVGRALGVLEHMADERGGVSLQALADRRQMPVASMHRLLAELSQLGYVRQLRDNQRYVLTTKLISLGFQCLSANGLADMVQPVLDNLARISRELVRLAVVDDERLTWVAKAQGAVAGLRYDPDMGREAKLFCTASGQAWLSSLPDAEALRIATKQGFGKPEDHGTRAPKDTTELLNCLRETRSRGYAVVVDSAAVGTAALGAAIVRPTDRVVVGTVSIAGPSARLDSRRMAEITPALLHAAAELAPAGQFIEFFQQ